MSMSSFFYYRSWGADYNTLNILQQFWSMLGVSVLWYVTRLSTFLADVLRYCFSMSTSPLDQIKWYEFSYHIHFICFIKCKLITANFILPSSSVLRNHNWRALAISKNWISSDHKEETMCARGGRWAFLLWHHVRPGSYEHDLAVKGRTLVDLTCPNDPFPINESIS